MHTTHSPRARVAAIAAFLTVPLLLLGCAAEAAPSPAAPEALTDSDGSPDATGSDTADAAPGSSASADSDSSATLTIGGTTYAVDLRFCSIAEEDVLMHGPATSDDGDPAYVDVDFTWLDDEWFGEVRIDLGVSEQFASSDEFSVFSTAKEGTKLIASVPSMSMFEVTGGFWHNGKTPSDGTFAADCG